MSFYSLYTDSMFETRLATVADAELIARHRRSMFVDAGQAEEAKLQEMVDNFVVWVRPRLSDGSYVGWIVEEEGRAVAGAGMWMMDFPPHWMDAEPARAYLLNFYVEPGVSWARARVRIAEECSGRGASAWDQSGFAARFEVW